MNNETLEQKDSSKKLSNLSIETNIPLKRDVLAKYQVNLDDVLTLSKKTMINLNKVLETISTKYLSVTALSIDHDLYREIKKQIKNRNKFVEKNLPFQVKEYDWLVNYTAQFIQKNCPQVKDDLKDIKNFLNKSVEFNSAIEKFEQDVIVNVIKTNFIPDLSFEDRKKYKENNQLYKYEEVFRDKVMFNMDLLGVDRHKTEVTLEKNASLWRKINMERTFNDYYYADITVPVDSVNLRRWEHLHQEHIAKWLKRYEFYYYQEHKDAIDEAGTATDNMKLSRSRIGEISQGVVQLGDLRSETVRDGFATSNFENIEHTIQLIY